MQKSLRFMSALFGVLCLLSGTAIGAGCFEERNNALLTLSRVDSVIPVIPQHVWQYLDAEEERIFAPGTGLDSDRRQSFQKLYSHEFYATWKVRKVILKTRQSAGEFPRTTRPTLQETSLALIWSHAAIVSAADLKQEMNEYLIRTPSANAPSMQSAVRDAQRGMLDYSNCLAMYILEWQIKKP